MRNTLLRKIFSITILVVAGFFLLFFIFRNPLLHWGIEKTAKIMKLRTGASLQIDDASFKGFSSISMKNILIIPSQGDTLLKADSVNVRISFWSLFVGTFRIKELFTTGVTGIISCQDSICNYSGFIHEKAETSTIYTGTNYSLMFRRLLDKVFNIAPQKANIHDVKLIYKNDSLERSINISEFYSDENSMKGFIEDNRSKNTWQLDGKFSQVKKTLQMNVFPVNNKTSLIPLTTELTGLSIGFDTVHVSLNGYHSSGNVLSLNGFFGIENFKAYHKKISEDTVRVRSATFEFTFNAGKNYLEIDSISKASLSNIIIHPYANYKKHSSEEKVYSLRLQTEELNAGIFLSSLPQGMFDEVRDIKATGNIRYRLKFLINSAKPDSLIFESALDKEKFRIKSFGSSELMKMNGEFFHSVYEKDRLVRSFFVGPSNPYFTPLQNISPAFINAVLTSEDGNFYFHNGFNEDAFRKSIITNFKAGKFVRGGSTISMQLVKNVYLSRKKTIARKAEEALIVWLIESNRLYSKERMLEVYMNIIELGPDVYGIGEAAEFYFRKKPQEITLPEGIFLASLLPHPKWFKYSFDTLGNLKPYLGDYYRIVSDFMLKKNLINQQEHDNLLPHVTLVGPAREMVIPTDSIPREENDESEQ
jgi:hypothetical protein